MIKVNIAILLLAVHFVADFILQTDWMAVNKSREWKPLLAHVAVYSATLIIFGFWFAILNGIFHLITDFVTSRITSKLWKMEKRHWFFVVIGADQFIHATTLLFTYAMLKT